MRIAILDDYQDAVRTLDCYALLKGHEVDVFTQPLDENQLAHALADHDAVVLIRERTKLTAALLARLPKLKLISQTGKVSGNVDVQGAQRLGITVMEGVGDPTAPAELTWALLMAAYRRIPQYVAHMKAGRWQTASSNLTHNTIGRALKGDTLGIWGYGKIGQMVARYGKAFGMDVTVWGREASREKALADGYRVAKTKEAFFEQVDALSVHLRLNDATRGILKAKDLALMKRTAVLVNTSRWELIEGGALRLALSNGRPGFAALDVFECEPLDKEEPLLKQENVLVTPHLGYVEQKGYELYFSAAFGSVVDFSQSRGL